MPEYRDEPTTAPSTKIVTSSHEETTAPVAPCAFVGVATSTLRFRVTATRWNEPALTADADCTACRAWSVSWKANVIEPSGSTTSEYGTSSWLPSPRTPRVIRPCADVRSSSVTPISIVRSRVMSSVERGTGVEVRTGAGHVDAI